MIYNIGGCLPVVGVCNVVVLATGVVTETPKNVVLQGLRVSWHRPGCPGCTREQWDRTVETQSPP